MTEYHQFEFTLRTVAPVHIGEGKTITTKESLYEEGEKRGNYYFPDMPILYKRMCELGLQEDFEEYLMGKGKRDLRAFFDQHQIKETDFGGYRIKETKYETEAKGKLNNIVTFIKDAYGNPYIPGSSLKGAIRTILVNLHFHTDNVKWGSSKDGVDDIFNEIRVSDSEPIPFDRLLICQKWDVSVKKGIPNPLPLFRESLTPFTKVKFTITTTTARAHYLIENLEEMAKQFYERNYAPTFLSAFPSKYIQGNYKAPVYLGAGSGLWSKVDHQHVDIERIRRRTPKKMKMKFNGALKLTKSRKVCYKSKKKDGSVEFHELITNTENLYEMGKCGFKIKEL